MKKRLKFLCLFAAAAFLASGCTKTEKASAPQGPASSSSENTIQILTIGTADSGGTMYPAGKAIAQVISDFDDHLKINVSASSGSAANVRALVNGEIDLGLVSGDTAFSAVNGREEFSGAPAEKLRVIAAVYPSLSNWISLSSSELTWVHELAGKDIGTGPQDSTTALSAELALDKLGITSANSNLVNYGLGAGAEEVKNGTLDAVHGFAGIPINSFQELAKSVPCRVLKYTDEELRAIIRENSFYYPDMIPAGTYEGQTDDIPTFGIKCLLCVSADMDEELVYELTSILYEHASELKKIHSALSAMDRKEFMYSTLPIELHPGAERFYREKGLLEESN